MDALIITLSSVGAFLAVSFIIFLFLIKPNRKREGMDEFVAVRYAHRGLHNESRPENSMSAFRAALDAGYAIELDVRLSSDGELVVFHDDTLDRVTSECGRVDERTAEELSKIHLLGTEDTIPTFKEVLSLVDGRVPLLLEIKEEAGKYGVTEKTVEVLSEYKGKFVIESFNPLALTLVKKRMPGVLRGILSQDFIKEQEYKKPMYFLLQCMLLNVSCRPDFIAFNHRDAKNGSLRLARKLFCAPTFAWTVRSEAEEKAARESGFDTVIFEKYLP